MQRMHQSSHPASIAAQLVEQIETGLQADVPAKAACGEQGAFAATAQVRAAAATVHLPNIFAFSRWRLTHSLRTTLSRDPLRCQNAPAHG